MVEPATQRGHRAQLAEVLLRIARVEELDLLCDIDRDASQLFDQVGLQMTAQHELEFAAAERRRWLECLRSGRTLLASNATGDLVGFAALAMLDGEGYLQQLSVRMQAMRCGVGTALLTATERMAEMAGARTLWLTTYQHLAWNLPFYEKAGFSVAAAQECGTELTQEFLFEQRLLPAPEKRVVMRKALRGSKIARDRGAIGEQE